MKLRATLSVALVLGLAVAGCGDGPADGGPLWEQVFGTWDCEAGGRPRFSFEVIRLSASGSDASWRDLAGGATVRASVWETSVYLKGATDQPFRNFEYKVVVPEVLDHLVEWTLTAGTDAPYRCVAR